jgi:hypothetical protein
MIQQGVGYTYTNNPRGASLVIDPVIAMQPHAPFKVYEDSTAEGEAILRVNAGTINNQLPLVGGAEIGTPNAYLQKPAGGGFIVLYIPASPSSGAPFPASAPLILFQPSIDPSSDTGVDVALAKVELITTADNPIPVMTINQLVTGSLWGERFECGSQLDYWFSQI